MQLRIFGDPELFRMGPVPVTETMVTSLAVTTVVFGVAAIAAWYVRSRPEHWLALLAELVVVSFDTLVQEIIGRPHALVAACASDSPGLQYLLDSPEPPLPNHSVTPGDMP